MSPTFGSLFAGIGGLDLGLERAGWEPIWQVENDPFCNNVLKKHWPEVKRYGDIKEIDWSEVERPDLICGGFPCQPISVAGKQLRQEDDRWLWPEFRRCLRGVRPRFVLVENVPGLLSGGMGDVLGDLAALGYDAEWESLPAAAFGAPHLRYRVFIVAHAHSKRGRAQQVSKPRVSHQAQSRDDGPQRAVAYASEYRLEGSLEAGSTAGTVGRGGTVADADSERLEIEREPESGGVVGARRGFFDRCGKDGKLLDTADERWWLTEPDVGRVAHGVPSRVDRLRALGNAVVPQVAEWIGKRTMETRNETQRTMEDDSNPALR